MSSYQLLSKWVKEHSIPLDLELYNFDPGTYQNPKQKMTAFDTLMVTNVNYADHIGQVIANKHNQTYLQQGGDVKKRLQAKLAKKKKQK